MSIDLDIFIDPHCHMFTAADVPLLTTIKQNIKHPLKVIVASNLAPILLKFGIIDIDKFVKFFDSESEENVATVSIELTAALYSNNIGTWSINAQEKILTPLVMDFDYDGKVNKFEAQVKRLVNAATAFKNNKHNVKVLPFVGLDPRRIIYKDDQLLSTTAIDNEVDGFLAKYDVKDAQGRRNRDELDCGDVIGIKLYPPLGFNVFPEEDRERDAYRAIYARLSSLEIPITVHCQEDSFDLTDGKVVKFTSPKNWVNVLAATNNLRINFGHFGGEEGVKDVIDWRDNDDPGDPIQEAFGIRKSGWAYEIIKMLKKYDNTFADISAFNFSDKKAVSSLLWILAYDKEGKFDLKDTGCPNYPLTSKLLWGSDYPMILSKKYPTYKEYFKAFVNTIIDRSKIRNNWGWNEYPLPPEDKLPNSVDLLKALCGGNGTKFLFG